MTTLQTANRLISELLNHLNYKCEVCSGPATRSAKFFVVIGSPTFFCDEHTHPNTRVEPRYEDLPFAALVREAQRFVAPIDPEVFRQTSLPPELLQKLIEEFPTVYQAPLDLDVTQGWFELLRDAGKYVRDHCPKGTRISYAKQKYGSLVLNTFPRVDDSWLKEGLDLIEERSDSTCEICGNNEGQAEETNDWMRTLCPTCFVKLEQSSDE